MTSCPPRYEEPADPAFIDVSSQLFIVFRFLLHRHVNTDVDSEFCSSVPALLEGFEIRECITFIEEHINRQVCLQPDEGVKGTVQDL